MGTEVCRTGIMKGWSRWSGQDSYDSVDSPVITTKVFAKPLTELYLSKFKFCLND